MQAILDAEKWIYVVLFWPLLALRVWAFVDCAIRKHAAFPAAGKLTKPVWLLINAASVAIAFLLGPGNVNSIFTLAFLVATLVYMTDVRPAVREVSGGSRW